jgi:hypothetical protein
MVLFDDIVYASVGSLSVYMCVHMYVCMFVKLLAWPVSSHLFFAFGFIDFWPLQWDTVEVVSYN